MNFQLSLSTQVESQKTKVKSQVPVGNFGAQPALTTGAVTAPVVTTDTWIDSTSAVLVPSTAKVLHLLMLLYMFVINIFVLKFVSNIFFSKFFYGELK